MANRWVRWDGHSHTQYCCHGSSETAEKYVQRAAELGFERYTISEHPPLPDRWVDDEALMKELAMPMAWLTDYFTEVEKLKDQYAEHIEVTSGLEIDYLYRSESFSDDLIAKWGERLDDIVVSVHFLPGKNGMRCIDFTPDDFRDAFLSYYGSMERVVDVYFDHVELAVEWGAKLPHRKRIGHLCLIEKFRRELPPLSGEQVDKRLRRLLPKLKRAGFAVDVNTAGMRVATCGKPYVPEWFMRKCMDAGIALVYGSDAHRPDQVGFGWDWFERICRTPEPGRHTQLDGN